MMRCAGSALQASCRAKAAGRFKCAPSARRCSGPCAGLQGHTGAGIRPDHLPLQEGRQARHPARSRRRPDDPRRVRTAHPPRVCGPWRSHDGILLAPARRPGKEARTPHSERDRQPRVGLRRHTRERLQSRRKAEQCGREARVACACFAKCVRRPEALRPSVESLLPEPDQDGKYVKEVRGILEVVSRLIDRCNDPTIPDGKRFCLWNSGTVGM